MASTPIQQEHRRGSLRGPTGFLAALSDARCSIVGPAFDALFFWGAPLAALLGVKAWIALAAVQSDATGSAMMRAMVGFSIIFTYAHLIAVVPRAYFNRDVFAANRMRLTLVPVLLIAGLVISPALFAIGGTAAILWDVHHSAMQNFGLARIYDMKAGNDPLVLRRTDLRLNWFLYVGPLAAGAALMTHLHALDRLDQTSLAALARLPGILQGQLSAISMIAAIAWAAAIGLAMLSYRRAIKAGYRPPAQKMMLIVSTGLVSLIAWGFSSPIIAFISINIYHAVQYFALVWLKEGQRMKALMGVGGHAGLLIFGVACGLFGFAYSLAAISSPKWIGGIFIACSLLHFWYDGFVWSVRKKQV